MRRPIKRAPRKPDIESVVSTLRNLVATDQSLPPERSIADQLGVTRHQLRRALQVLRNRGEIVTPAIGRAGALPAAAGLGEALVRVTNPIEVIEIRLIVEPPLARLGAIRATPADLARIMAAATTDQDMTRGQGDLLFHTRVAVAARNSLAADLYTLLRRVGTDARLRVNSEGAACPERLRQRDEEHLAIAKAMVNRDPDGAEDAMRAHLTTVQNRILTASAPKAAPRREASG